MTILVVNTEQQHAVQVYHQFTPLCYFHTLSTLHDDAANYNCNDGSCNDYKQRYTNSHSCKNQDINYNTLILCMLFGMNV